MLESLEIVFDPWPCYRHEFTVIDDILVYNFEYFGDYDNPKEDKKGILKDFSEFEKALEKLDLYSFKDDYQPTEGVAMLDGRGFWINYKEVGKELKMISVSNCLKYEIAILFATVEQFFPETRMLEYANDFLYSKGSLVEHIYDYLNDKVSYDNLVHLYINTLPTTRFGADILLDAVQRFDMHILYNRLITEYDPILTEDEKEMLKAKYERAFDLPLSKPHLRNTN